MLKPVPESAMQQRIAASRERSWKQLLAASWSSPQRAALATLLLALCAYGFVRVALDRRFVSDPQPSAGSRSDELADQIDPNIADVATLAAIPQLGAKRAAAIVAYREGARATTKPGEQVFAEPNDLLRVNGVGYTTVQSLKQYLIFPTTRPASESGEP